MSKELIVLEGAEHAKGITNKIITKREASLNEVSYSLPVQMRISGVVVWRDLLCASVRVVANFSLEDHSLYLNPIMFFAFKTSLDGFCEEFYQAIQTSCFEMESSYFFYYCPECREPVDYLYLSHTRSAVLPGYFCCIKCLPRRPKNIGRECNFQVEWVVLEEVKPGNGAVVIV